MFKKLPLWLNVLIIFIQLFLLVYLALFVYVCVVSRTSHPFTKADAMVVLGCQVKPDGSPSVQLLYRLESAYTAYQKNPMPIVCTGGQGANEPLPEGEMMANWLLEKGVPKEHLLLETTSKTTKENLANALQLLPKKDMHINIVTSDYHLSRALSIAKDLNMQASGVGAPTRPEYFLKNYGREALAFGKYLLLKWCPLLTQWFK